MTISWQTHLRLIHPHRAFPSLKIVPLKSKLILLLTLVLIVHTKELLELKWSSEIHCRNKGDPGFWDHLYLWCIFTFQLYLLDVLVFLFLKSPKNYVHNIIIELWWDGSIRVIYLLVWVNTPWISREFSAACGGDGRLFF